MGGDVTVESVYGKGSTFTATIIQGVQDNKPMGALGGFQDSPQAANLQAAFIAPGLSVLLVDDVSTNLLVATGLLSPYNFDIVECLGGEQALEVAKKAKFDLMFIDHMMPGWDGVETLKRIRELGGEYSKVPAVALTANAVNEARDMLLASGFDDFLAKPIEVELLAAILEKWVPKNLRQQPQAAKAGQTEPSIEA
jgi:CheY-like chemotaxis protein